MQRKKLWKMHKTKSIAFPDVTAGSGITVMRYVKKNNGMMKENRLWMKKKCV